MIKQLDLLKDIGHGGRRKGAGRPRKDKSLQLHLARPVLKKEHPLHVNIKLIKGLPSLRSKDKFKIVKRAILKSRMQGLKIIHFSIQKTHIHLLVESHSKEELGKGMKSFNTSIAKSINGRLKRKGQVFKDRYHLHILKTLKETRNALLYIFNNYAKHSKTVNRFDKYSSFVCFAEKKRLGLSKIKDNLKDDIREKLKDLMSELIIPPESWHLRVGWKRI